MRLFESRMFRLVLFLLALLSVTLYVIGSIDRIREFDFHFDPLSLVFALLFVTAGHFANLMIWIFLAASFGIRVPFASSGRAWFLSRLGRYIPGKLPFLLYRISVYREFPKRVVTVATAVEYFISVCAASVIILTAMVAGHETFPGALRWIALALMLLIPLALYPPVMKSAVNRMLGLMKREPITEVPALKVTLMAVAGYVAGALLHGLGFLFVLRSVTEVPLHLYLTVTGAYYGAGLVALAAFFAPRGLGVLEGVLFLILPAVIARPVIIIGAIGMRVTVSLTELACAGLFAVIPCMKRGARNGAPPHDETRSPD